MMEHACQSLYGTGVNVESLHFFLILETDNDKECCDWISLNTSDTIEKITSWHSKRSHREASSRPLTSGLDQWRPVNNSKVWMHLDTQEVYYSEQNTYDKQGRLLKQTRTGGHIDFPLEGGHLDVVSNALEQRFKSICCSGWCQLVLC